MREASHCVFLWSCRMCGAYYRSDQCLWQFPIGHHRCVWSRHLLNAMALEVIMLDGLFLVNKVVSVVGKLSAAGAPIDLKPWTRQLMLLHSHMNLCTANVILESCLEVRSCH
eukprot:5515674-Amphidinium_carterae.1